MKKLSLVGLSLFAASSLAFAQSSEPPKFEIGSIKLSGTLDGYYSFNNNHPSNRINTQHNFDVSANSFDLNFAKMRLEMAPEPVGFTFDFGFGSGMEIFSAAEPGGPGRVPSFMNHVTQAYLSVKPKNWGGVQLDFGKFYTSAGAELTETYTNWNYSRSLVFTNGPFYHFGARLSVPMGSHFTGGVQLVNGWNNVIDNNSGKTVGLTGALNYSKVSWANTYYFGPENSALDSTGALQGGDVGKGMRHFFDTALTVTPNDNFAFYVNYDYGSNRFKINNTQATWWTVAFAGKIGPKKLYFAPRFEIYDDTDGYITGTKQQLKEFTATVNYEFVPGIMTKFEYRRDFSDANYFLKGTNRLVDGQSTALVGLVMYFPLPK